MAVQGVGDPSERIFAELRNKNDEVRQRAANELRDLVNLLSRGRLQRNMKQNKTDIVDQNGRPNDSAAFTTDSQHDLANLLYNLQMSLIKSEASLLSIA